MKCKDTPYVTMRKNMHKKKNSRPLLLPELEIKTMKRSFNHHYRFDKYFFLILYLMSNIYFLTTFCSMTSNYRVHFKVIFLRENYRVHLKVIFLREKNI